MIYNKTGNISWNATIYNHGKVSQDLPIPTSSKAFLYVGYILIFVVGTLGNSLVIYKTAFKKPSKRIRRYHHQIVSLAIADLLGSVFIPINMIHDITNYDNWLLGSFGCKLITSMNPFLAVTSAWMMVAISLTRFRIIRRSAKLNLGKYHCNWLGILVAWLLGVGIASPYAYHLNKDELGVCLDVWGDQFYGVVWKITLAITWCPLPLSILLLVSLLSYQNLKRNSIKKTNSSHGSRNRSQSVAKTFSIIILAFFLLTTPYAVFFSISVYTIYYNNPNYRTNRHLFLSFNHVLFFISSITSVINPFIYERAVILKYFKRWRNITVNATTEVSKSQTIALKPQRKFSEIIVQHATN